MTTNHIAHIGVAVPDIEAAGRFYEEILGAEAKSMGRADGARIVSYELGGIDVELLQPEIPDSPVARFLAKRGSGIHHVCIRVPDLAAALDRCREKGYQLIDDEPREGAHGHPIAFIHPRSTGGILIELTE